MATIGSSKSTLQDVASRTQDGKIQKIVEVLNQTNEILTDMSWVEGNLATGHKTSIRSGLPSVAWRQLNYGVQPSKSKSIQVTDTCGILEAFSEVDKEVADLNGNTSDFRFSEDTAFLEAMSQEMASTLFYGNTNLFPEKFLGLAPRYNDLNAENAVNILNGGGSGNDNTSVWLVNWGEQTCYGIIPKGSKAGLTHTDLGVRPLTDSNGGKYLGYCANYQWKAGITLKDWRYVSRIANIDVSELTKDASGSSADIIELMIRAVHKIPAITMGFPVFYVNKTIYTYLDLQTYNSKNVNVSYGTDVHGKPVMLFRGIPVRKCEAILDTEATVS